MSKSGSCTVQQANTALRAVLGPAPPGRCPSTKTLAQHRYEHAHTKGHSGVVRLFNTLEFRHEDYTDRCYRMRCHTDQPFHDKFPVVSSTHANTCALCM